MAHGKKHRKPEGRTLALFLFSPVREVILAWSLLAFQKASEVLFVVIRFSFVLFFKES